MQRRFPLLNLPDLPFENVYGYLGFEDLIHLASCSNRLKSLVQTMELNQKKLTNFRFGNPRFENTDIVRHLSLYDRSQGRPRKEFHISFCTYTHASSTFLSVNEKNIGGRIWYVYQPEDGEWLIEETTECQLFWFKYLKDLFNCRIAIRLKFDRTNLSSETLLLDTDLLHVADMITIHLESRTSVERLTYLLNNLQAQQLDITCRHDPELKLGDLVVKSRCLTLESARFLNLRDVWKIVQGGICRQLDLRETKDCSSRDINQFIENWLNSDNTTLEVLEFDVRVFRHKSDEPILFGIPNSPGCKKREDAAEYYNEYTLYEEGRDIRRKDGLLATFVEKSSGQFSGRFSFTVWYCLDPNDSAADNN